MKLIFTPNTGYIHKVLVVAYEAGIVERLTFERTRPFDPNTTIWSFNPFGKVPVLELDNGEPLFGGLVICEYFNSLSVTGVSVYPTDEARWPALRQMMLGDGLFDATTLLRVEGWRDKAVWNLDYMQRERRKMINALDRMELEAPQFASAPFHIGHICMAGGLSYLGLRNPIREYALEPGDADFDWRANRPHLSKWFDAIQTRPSMQFKVELPEER
ncbi:MAG: glutathione S-transferase N-terminal domain-containing protein [Rhodospirillaceae bacterium]|nr:glutathione S-transferase N-terminal domain-containing protein [Rhodospirillaceae bacterium]